MADGTTKAIEEVAVGDLLMSRSESTRRTEPHRVISRSVRWVVGSLVVHFSNGEKIETTGEHPFFVADRGFRLAADLQVGMEAVTLNGPPVKITKIEADWQRRIKVYNFTVSGFHTYFVGSDGVWVHNGPLEKDDDDGVP